MNEFISFLDAGIKSAEDEKVMLEQTDRQDEANFARIKQNIYTIAKTVYDVFSREKGESMKSDYAAKLSSMRESWEASLALAQEHGNAKVAAVESVKIDTMRLIEENFRQTEEENDV